MFHETCEKPHTCHDLVRERNSYQLDMWTIWGKQRPSCIFTGWKNHRKRFPCDLSKAQPRWCCTTGYWSIAIYIYSECAHHCPRMTRNTGGWISCHCRQELRFLIFGSTWVSNFWENVLIWLKFCWLGL